MLKKLTLAAGFGAGYVLGAKAGTERYNQIQAKFQEFTGKPAVQNATSQVKDTASSAADTAKQTLSEKASTVQDKVKSSDSSSDKDVVVDLGTTPVTPPPSGAKTTSTPPLSTTGTTGTTGTPVVTPKPMPGASASETAPGTNRL